MTRHDANWLKEHNGRYQWHPMSDPNQVEREPPMIVVEGDGVHVTDIDGKRYLDCQGGLWCVNVGHGRDEIKAAIVEQLDKLQYYTLFPGSTNAPSIELSVKMCEIAAPEGITKVHFTSGGSDSVETALKITRQYWKLMGAPERTKIFSLKHGYHGVHFGGLSAGGSAAWKRAFEPLLPNFFQIDSPYLYRNTLTQDHEELGAICAAMLDREIEHQGPDTVAAFMAEPVQGAGGVIVPPPNFWPLVREVCDKHDVLLIADEVITGLGRSGSLFGCRGWGVKPDIMCMAKGISSAYIPLGATLIGEKVEAAWKGASDAAFMQGVTYAGHPVACAAGIASVDIIVAEDLAANAAATGAYLLEKLEDLGQRHPPIGDVRGKGLMAALELVKDRGTKEPFAPDDPYPKAISQACVEQGVIVRNLAHKLVMSPPLTFTTDHADELVGALDEAFERVPL